MLVREWVVGAVGAALAVTTLLRGRLPSYDLTDFEVLYIILVLLVVVKGLERADVFSNVAAFLRSGRLLSFQLVVATALLSMAVTNDVALFVAVPVTTALETDGGDLLVILETLAANAGSALSPIGNPQNLFIYWFYRLHALEFVRAIAPFTAVCLGAILLTSLAIPAPPASRIPTRTSRLTPSGGAYLAFLALFALAILKIVPLWVGAAPLLYAALFDRGTLRVDYALLLIFACIFGLTDNVLALAPTTVGGGRRTFWYAAFGSQVLSNVPAAVFMADFTPSWKPLLWGVSVGGFGSLIASLANLIAYRLYRDHTRSPRAFLLKLHAAGYLAFAVGCVAYLVLQ
ncbi:MAG: citrate transporter [Deltaproteobacteria bacterium]|nr:citrate transporter [Deltaproteobacteria bacterium]